MSILGDGLMGALDVGRGYLQADIKAEAKSKEADETAARQEATDIRRDDMAQKRAIATEQLKEEFAIQQEARKVSAGDAYRAKMTSDIDGAARGLISARMPNNQVVDQASWTPEMEAARNQGLDAMVTPRDRAVAAVKAGYLKEAMDYDKIAESGTKILSPYAQMRDSEGNLLATNDAAGKAEAAREAAKAKADSAANVAGIRAGGKTADHFDEKLWANGFSKMNKSAVSVNDPMTGSEINPELSNIWRSTFNAKKADGDVSPDEAVAHADEIAVRVKRKAEGRVKAAQANDKKSTLTVDEAIQDIFKEKQAADRRAKEPQVEAEKKKSEPATKPAEDKPKASGLIASRANQTEEAIPEPPPQTRNIGLSQSLNPAYVEWAKKYKEVWDQQRNDKNTMNDKAADAAKASYNPYRQNRVN